MAYRMTASQKSRHENALDSFHPVFAAKINIVISQLRAKGWHAYIHQGKTRTEAQAKKNAKEGDGIVNSWHRKDVHKSLRAQVVELYAADIIDARWAWGGEAASKSHQFWKDLGAFAKANGLAWGGDWKKKDVAHVEMAIVESSLEVNFRDSVVI